MNTLCQIKQPGGAHVGVERDAEEPDGYASSLAITCGKNRGTNNRKTVNCDTHDRKTVNRGTDNRKTESRMKPGGAHVGVERDSEEAFGRRGPLASGRLPFPAGGGMGYSIPVLGAVLGAGRLPFPGESGRLPTRQCTPVSRACS